MPPVTCLLKETAKMVLSKTDKLLEPASSQEIAGHITLMLQHYFKDATIPPSVAEGMALQWLKCLEEFPNWVVEKAVTEYMKNDSKGRRPVPGQIVAEARKVASKCHALKIRCLQVIKAKEEPAERPPKTPEEIAAVEKILQEAGIRLKSENKGAENGK